MELKLFVKRKKLFNCAICTIRTQLLNVGLYREKKLLEWFLETKFAQFRCCTEKLFKKPYFAESSHDFIYLKHFLAWLAEEKAISVQRENSSEIWYGASSATAHNVNFL